MPTIVSGEAALLTVCARWIEVGVLRECDDTGRPLDKVVAVRFDTELPKEAVGVQKLALQFCSAQNARDRIRQPHFHRCPRVEKIDRIAKRRLEQVPTPAPFIHEPSNKGMVGVPLIRE